MNQVIAALPDHAQALTEHEDVTHHLFEREPGPDITDAEWPGDAVDPAVRDVDVLTFVQGQQVDLVPPRTEELENRFDGKRGSPRLKEWVRGKHEDPHPTASMAASKPPVCLSTS